ncbi:uncharacterized protein [Hetaerina americana]|uniref:uncharacterized protein n=1 Tax=Hetaerina americana TaxID=62018 RepID=UPI003A7F58B4
MIDCWNASMDGSYKEIQEEKEIQPEGFQRKSDETTKAASNGINDGGDGTRGNGNTDGKGCKQNADTEGDEYLRLLLEGASVPLDTEVPMNSRPPWMDPELLRKGREFGTKYLFGLVFSQLLSLAILFSFRGGLEPLIFTGKSGTPYTAFRRYLSTVTRIVSWYESDTFEEDSEAYKNMAAVRAKHASVFKRMNEASSSDDLKSKITLEGKETGIWCTYLEELKKDLRGLRTYESSCPFAEISSLGPKDGSKSREVIYINQLDLSLTQLGFVGLCVLYPQQFGAYDATEDELRGYVHLWRCLGYFLGIKDRYNICSSGDLEVTRMRLRAVMEKWTKPGLRDLTPEWEHMFRCVVEGVGYYVPMNAFGSSVAYLLWVLDIPSPNLLSRMTWMEKILFYVQRLVLNYMMRIPGYRQFCNYMLNGALNKARNASADWLQRKREKVYEFQKFTQPIVNIES